MDFRKGLRRRLAVVFAMAAALFVLIESASALYGSSLGLYFMRIPSVFFDSLPNSLPTRTPIPNPVAPPYSLQIGVEAIGRLFSGSELLMHVQDSGVSHVRLNGRIAWAELQPIEDGPIDWTPLSAFEQELLALHSAGLSAGLSAGVQPIVIVDEPPIWARTNVDWKCSGIRADKVGRFAEFMHQLVQRYSQPPFEVRIWELGNEPDIDPRQVSKNSVFGCWGNWDEAYYGGRSYGEMLKVVSPRIRAADAKAEIWIGGLLLDRPDSNIPNQSRPELFLQGILEAGAGNDFDAVPFHFYPFYSNDVTLDYSHVGWSAWGGGLVGKAFFLRSIMAQYGVEKPLHLDETALVCPNHEPAYLSCTPPVSGFYIAAARYAARAAVQCAVAGIHSLTWYVVDEGGWWNSGLYDTAGQPRLVQRALRTAAANLQGIAVEGATTAYGPHVEAYSFRRSDQKQILVLWSHTESAVVVPIAPDRFLQAFDMSGDSLTPTMPQSDWLVTVGPNPVYIVLQP